MTEYLLPNDIVELAARVVAENAAIGRKIVLAESCTGGMVAAAITEIPGSSAVLDRGFVTYSNAAKHEVLGVNSDLVETFGAVSAATVWAMAQGALSRSDADVAVAISWVAGPDGGTGQKPVGTVTFARCIRGDDTVDADERLLDGSSRAAVRHQATLVALELLLP